ncbi:MAG: hypothetical protein NVSMB4_07540 [Acidimicrobiales bacterium]
MDDDPGDPFTEEDQKRLDRKIHNAAIGRITKRWTAMDDPNEDDLQDCIELEGYEINDEQAFYGMYTTGQPLRTIIAAAIVDQRPRTSAA